MTALRCILALAVCGCIGGGSQSTTDASTIEDGSVPGGPDDDTGDNGEQRPRVDASAGGEEGEGVPVDSGLDPEPLLEDAGPGCDGIGCGGPILAPGECPAGYTCQRLTSVLTMASATTCANGAQRAIPCGGDADCAAYGIACTAGGTKFSPYRGCLIECDLE